MQGLVSHQTWLRILAVLSLSTFFDSHSIKDCLPNNIQFIVDKIDKNYHVAVFIAEYSDLNSQTGF